jgi:membrane associated rhomboid family serine protease
MFFLLPVGVDYRAQRYPMVTFTLMGLNTLIYLIELVVYLFALQNGDPHEVEEWVQKHFWLIPNQSVWYTYITTLFVHEGFFHLAGNMVYLYLFGACVEDVVGRWQFVIYYLLGGLAADFGHIVDASFASDIPLGGASGAISACLGGFILLLPKTKINFRWFFFILVRLFNGDFWLPAWLVLSFWFLQDLAAAVLAHSAGVSSDTAFAAHTGGFLAGMAMIGSYKLTRRLPIWPQGTVDEEIVEATSMSEDTAGVAATIYLYEGQTELGPFTPAQITEMLSLGSLSPEALYWQEGMDGWSSVNQLRRG